MLFEEIQNKKRDRKTRNSYVFLRASGRGSVKKESKEREDEERDVGEVNNESKDEWRMKVVE